MRLTKGILIVFEGIDGSGKSTQVLNLRKKLEEKAFAVVCFREPSQSLWGREIKAKSAIPDSLTPEEELELFQKDRAENVEANLKPALAEKKIVILDRYYYSTLAYQGAKGIDKKRILRLNKSFAVEPDLVFVLDVRAAQGLQRISERKSRDFLFERRDYLEEVRRNFLELSGQNIVHINGEKPEEDVNEDIARIVFSFIKKYIAKN